MASKVEIDALVNGASSLSIRNKAQKIRGFASKHPEYVYLAESLEEIQDSVVRLWKASTRGQNASHIEIDSADILNLIVGGRDGPGQLTILSGPPNYTRIGWDGTDSSGIAVTITSVSGATVNTATAHGLEEDDIILIDGNTSLNHLGYWVVATTPTTTSYTLADPPSGAGTGGTSTLQFGGGWRRSFAIGGTGFTDAPFFAKHGVVYIGKNGSVSLRDSFFVEKGYIGVTAPEAPKPVSGTADNGGLVRLTVIAHGFENGDTVIAGSAGYAVTVIDANTIDLIGSVFGTFTPVASVSRYFAGIWDEQHASGGTGYENAPFRAKADGSIRIGDPALPHFEVASDGSILIGEAAGPRLEISAAGDMSITDAIISLNSNGITTDINNQALSDFGLTDSAGLKMQDNTSDDYVALTPDKLMMYDDSTAAPIVLLGRFNFGFGDTILFDIQGGIFCEDITVTGEIEADVVTANTPILVVSGGTGSNTAAGARTNLDVYSKAETDALVADLSDYYTKTEIDNFLSGINAALANKSDIGHSHGTLSITSTTGTVAHTHTGSAS